MNNLWFLAAAGDEGGIISSESSENGFGADEEGYTTEDGTTAPGSEDTNQRSPLGYLPLIGIFVIMYLLLFRGPRKKQQQHAKMVKSLEKNARVKTIGGIFGTVIDIKDDEITIKIDESNNTKIKVASNAIGAVLSDETNL